MSGGIFSHTTDDLFAIYRLRLRFRDRVVGGTPSSKELIEAWLRTKLGISKEEELKRMALQTLKELGLEPEVFGAEADAEDVSFENIAQAAEIIAKKSNTTMFKRDVNGLYIEQRAVKAMLKEGAAILFPGSAGAGMRAHKWGATGKAPKGAITEWVFIEPDHISLGVQDATAVDLSIGHISTPKGPRSTLDYYEYVDRPTIEFTVMVLQNRVPAAAWPALWRYTEENGLGAKRSQGFGRFDVLAWDPMNGLAKSRGPANAVSVEGDIVNGNGASPVPPERGLREPARGGAGRPQTPAPAGRRHHREFDRDGLRR